MHVPTSSSFKQNARRALDDAGLQRALARSVKGLARGFNRR